MAMLGHTLLLLLFNILLVATSSFSQPKHPYIAEITTPDNPSPPSHGIILIDPFADCFGGYLTQIALEKYKVGVVTVYSPYSATGIQRMIDQQDDDDDDDDDGGEREGNGVKENVMTKIAPLDDTELSKWLHSLPFRIVAVLCETDSGLDYAERLSCAIDRVTSKTKKEEEKKGEREEGVVRPLLLRHNGYNEARRNKYQMNEICRDAGIAVVRQTLCRSPQEAVQKADALFGISSSSPSSSPTPKAIIKPLRGVASDRITLCTTPSSIRTATAGILNTAVFGTYDVSHTEVLLQEYVEGVEYAVDVVSRDGKHVICAIWVYEKISTEEDGESNPFVYSCTRLVSSDDRRHPSEKIVRYVESVLDALGIRWGMTHNEVKVTPGGEVRLMEVNVRQHNTDFAPLCRACVGYEALGLCLAAYLGDRGGEDGEGCEDEFDAVPRLPILKYNGAVSVYMNYAMFFCLRS